MGLAFSAIIGVTLDPYGLRGEDDYRQALDEGYARGYDGIQKHAHQEGDAFGYAVRLKRIIVTEGDSPGNEYADGFREGWSDGWRGSIEAMTSAAHDAGYQDGPEIDLLLRALRALSREPLTNPPIR